MSYIQWGGKKWYQPKPQPRKPDINELMKPLSEKVGRGNIWGSVITNVQKDGGVAPTPPPSWTPAEMTNLFDWWRADTGLTLTGSDVDSWEGYNGTLFTPVSSSLKATYTSSSSNWNSQAAITINPTNSASNAGYSATTNTGAISRTIYGVFRVNSISNETGLFTMEDGALAGVKRASYILRTTDIPAQLYYFQGGIVGGADTYANTGIEDGVGSYIFGAIEYNATAATKTVKFYASNSSTLGSSPVATTSGTATAGSVPIINLGYYARFLPLPAQSMDVVEVISVDGLLNSSDVSNLETYINTRYGI